MGSGRSPQNAQLTSITKRAGRLPNPARAPNPPAANTALSRSVRNLFQIGSLIGGSSRRGPHILAPGPRRLPRRVLTLDQVAPPVPAPPPRPPPPRGGRVRAGTA